MSAEIAKLGHVALVTPNLEKSTWFWRDVLGLEEVMRTEDKVYLRAWGEWEHHSLLLLRGNESVVDHIGWRTKRPEDIDLFAETIRNSGVEVESREAGSESGHGRAIRFRLPGSGHVFELYYDVTKIAARPERRSRLKNQTARAWDHGVSPRRIDHVNINVPDPPSTHDWLSQHLYFKTRERIRLNNGFVPAAWMSVTPLVHDLAVMFDSVGRQQRFHHLAYYTDNWQDVLRAADIFRENGIRIDVGPGRHGISQAFFLYVKDPGSGHRVELFSGGYLILDPDWEPVEWKEDELEEGIIWWGSALPATFLEDSTGPGTTLPSG